MLRLIIILQRKKIFGKIVVYVFMPKEKSKQISNDVFLRQKGDNNERLRTCAVHIMQSFHFFG